MRTTRAIRHCLRACALLICLLLALSLLKVSFLRAPRSSNPSLAHAGLDIEALPSARIYSMAFSPDSAMMATGESGGILRLWSLKEGRLLWAVVVRERSANSPPPFASAVRDVAFSPDGRTLAIAAGVRGVSLWDVRSGGH